MYVYKYVDKCTLNESFMIMLVPTANQDINDFIILKS